jgi:aspartic proteinase inhibitor
MRKTRIVWMLSILSFVELGLALETYAQTPGAYRLVPNDDSESLAAAKFAVQEEGQKLGKTVVFTSMVYAQRQVVSGTNHKLCLKVKVNGTSKRAETVVYRDLQKQFKLTSWKWGECMKPVELRTTTPGTPSEKP